MPTPRPCPWRILLALLICHLLPAVAGAAAPAVFVKVSSDQLAAGATPSAATTLTVSEAGSGWNFSGAAPHAGTTWNVVNRPNPGIPSGSLNGTVGTFVMGNINGLALVDSGGAASPVRLTCSMIIADLESGSSTRGEPNAGTGSSDTVLGPKGLMEKPWRIYRGGNSALFQFSGLPAGASYHLYVYASTADARGAVFTLEPANVPVGVTATALHTSGSTGGNVFQSDGTHVTPTTPATPNTASAGGQNTVWGRLHAVVANDGTLSFRTSKNAQNNQYFNGIQLVPFPLPTISLQPSPTTEATIGSDVSLSVSATGEGGLGYQWRKGGVAIAGNASATTGTLTLTNVQAGDAASYDVVISNPGGSVTSSASVLSVGSSIIAPSVNTPPASATSVVGGTVSFSAIVNGTSPLSYQWQRSNNNSSFTDLPGAGSAALTLTSVTPAQAGYYRLVVTNSAGSATSASAALTVAPTLTTAPSAAIVAAGAAHVISVVADAGAGAPEPITYVWKRDGALVGEGSGVSGSATASLQVGSFSAAQSGYYTVTVSNSAGSSTSAPVYVGVASTQSVSLAPASGATGIAIDQQLRLVFPGAPRIGRAGVITVRDAADDAVVATINVAQFQTYSLFGATITNGAVRTVQGASCFYTPLAIHGNEAWITLSPTQRLSYSKTYYVTMDPGVLLDSTNAAHPGVTGPATWRFSTKASGPATPTASTGPTTITVGHDGTGDFATLQAAADWIPQNNTLPRTILLRAGTYRDNALFTQNRNFVTVLGEGSSRRDVLLYYPYGGYSPGNDRSCGTLRLESNNITVRNLTIDNGVYLPMPSSGAPAFAGPINTVVTTGSRLIFDNVLMLGGQDTLYASSGVAYFRNCEIWGSVDFIYGGALTVFDNCDIVEIRDSGGPICAPSTPFAQPYGEVFLNCRFPRALVANGYPYNVGVGSSTFMRPWRQDGMTALINCQLDTHLSVKGWSEWSGSEVGCRAREHGSTLLGGGGAPTVAERQAAGAYWLNTVDPDYTGTSMPVTDPLIAPATGTGNRVAVTVNPADYTLAAIFGHPYFALNGWMPDAPPGIATQPLSQTVNVGVSAGLSVIASGDGPFSYQWQKDDAGLYKDIAGATSATLAFPAVQQADAGKYRVVVTNPNGSATSQAAVLTVDTPLFSMGAPDGFASEVTGGGSLTPVIVSTPAALKAAVEATAPAVITVSGVINMAAYGSAVRIKSNKTLQGLDSSAGIVGNINLGSDVANVIIRGLTLTHPGTHLGTDGRYTDGGDGISIEGAKRIFITHCTVFDCADGLIDTRLGADLVTISWCKFYYTAGQADHRFTMISDGLLIRDPVTDAVIQAGAPLRITMHHNWWSERCDQRQPSSTNGHIHLYNNHWNAPGNSYASVARDCAQFLSENNVYRNVRDALGTSDNNALLANGLIRSIGNLYLQCTGATPHAGGDPVFTPAYSYTLHPTGGTAGNDVVTLATTYAGNTAGLNSQTPAEQHASITGPAAGSSLELAPTGTATLAASFTGFSAVSQQWRLNNFPIPGATAASHVISSMDAGQVGLYTVELLLANGERVVSAPFAVTLGASLPPAITTQPASQVVAAGSPVTFTVVATGTPAPTYQWRHYGVDGVARALPGATGASLTLPEVTTEEATRYDCVVTQGGASVTSQSAVLSVPILTTSNPSARLVNLSARSHVRNGVEATIVGFVVKGTGSNRLLVRASGPTLRGFGLTQVVEDPVMELFNQADTASLLAQNDNWASGGVETLRAAFVRTQAFDWNSDTTESALLREFQAGDYTAVVRGKTTDGIGLVELYEDLSAGSRLVNLSARAVMSSGEHTLTAGFVIKGTGLKTVLVRLAGPALQPFLAGYATDPVLRVYNQGNVDLPIASNDDWDSDSAKGDQIDSLGRALKAFAWTRGSADAAILLTLRAGSYTVEGASKNGSGVALVEVYEVNE